MTRSQALNVFWSGSEAAISAALSFISAFVVARLIGPSEVGIGAAAVAVHVLLWVAVSALFADALVQRSELDDTMFSSAFAASIAVGCAAALVQAAAGLPLSLTLGDGRMMAMSLLLALPLPLVGAAGPVQGLLTRERAYRALALRTVVGQGARYVRRHRRGAQRSRCLGPGAAAMRRLRGGRARLAGALPAAPASPLCLDQAGRTAAYRPAADGQHTGPFQPLSPVRAY